MLIVDDNGVSFFLDDSRVAPFVDDVGNFTALSTDVAVPQASL